MVVSNVLLVGLTEKLVCLSTGAPCICVLKGHNWVCGKNSLFQMAVAVLEKKNLKEGTILGVLQVISLNKLSS